MKPFNQWTFVEVMAFVKSVDKKTWVTLVSSVAGFLLVVVFLVIPAWIERPRLRRDIQSMEAQIRQVRALSQKRAGWEENQKIFGALIAETQNRLFTEESLGLLLGQISKMANESHVDVLASKPVTEKAVFEAPYHLKYQPSGYEFKVQGGYHDLGDLISRIESYEQLLRVRNLGIVPSKTMPGKHVAELKIWAILEAPPLPEPAKATKGKRA